MKPLAIAFSILQTLFLLATQARGQDHLEPEDSFWVISRIHHNVEARDSLLQGCSDYPLVRAVCNDEGPIWAVSLDQDSAGSSFVVRGAQSEKSIGLIYGWATPKDLRRARFDRSARLIPQLDAQRISDVFYRILFRTSSTDGANRAMTVGGYRAWLSVKDVLPPHYLSGTIANPEDGSDAQKLVLLAYSLFRYAFSNTQDSQVLLERIRDAVEELSEVQIWRDSTCPLDRSRLHLRDEYQSFDSTIHLRAILECSLHGHLWFWHKGEPLSKTTISTLEAYRMEPRYPNRSAHSLHVRIGQHFRLIKTKADSLGIR